MGEWIKKLWYVHTMECFLAMRLNLKISVLNKRSQTTIRTFLYDSSCINARKCKLIYSNRKETTGHLQVGVAMKADRRVLKGPMEAFGCDGYIHDLVVVTDS